MSTLLTQTSFSQGFAAQMITAETYKAELAFLQRKLPAVKLKWELRPAMDQIISPTLADAEATKILTQFRDIFGKRTGSEFSRMVFAVNSKLQGGVRLAISVKVLRDFFGHEIDGSDGGGGGRGYNPLSTRPGRGSAGV